MIREGDRDELLKQGGHYATPFSTYFRRRSLAYRPEWVEDRLRGKMGRRTRGKTEGTCAEFAT